MIGSGRVCEPGINARTFEASRHVPESRMIALSAQIPLFVHATFELACWEGDIPGTSVLICLEKKRTALDRVVAGFFTFWQLLAVPWFKIVDLRYLGWLSDP